MKLDSQSFYVQVTFQWDLVSLLVVSGNLPLWRLSWAAIKNVSTEREGKEVAKLNPTDTPPPWLRWSSLQVKPKLAGLSPRCLGDGPLLPQLLNFRVCGRRRRRAAVPGGALGAGVGGKCSSRCRAEAVRWLRGDSLASLTGWPAQNRGA